MNREVKLSFSTVNVIVHVDNFKEFTHQENLQDLVYETGKGQNIKSIQNANECLYSSSKQ